MPPQNPNIDWSEFPVQPSNPYTPPPINVGGQGVTTQPIYNTQIDWSEFPVQPNQYKPPVYQPPAYQPPSYQPPPQSTFQPREERWYDPFAEGAIGLALPIAAQVALAPETGGGSLLAGGLFNALGDYGTQKYRQWTGLQDPNEYNYGETAIAGAGGMLGGAIAGKVLGKGASTWGRSMLAGGIEAPIVQAPMTVAQSYVDTGKPPDFGEFAKQEMMSIPYGVLGGAAGHATHMFGAKKPATPGLPGDIPPPGGDGGGGGGGGTDPNIPPPPPPPDGGGAIIPPTGPDVIPWRGGNDAALYNDYRRQGFRPWPGHFSEDGFPLLIRGAQQAPPVTPDVELAQSAYARMMNDPTVDLNRGQTFHETDPFPIPRNQINPFLIDSLRKQGINQVALQGDNVIFQYTGETKEQPHVIPPPPTRTEPPIAEPRTYEGEAPEPYPGPREGERPTIEEARRQIEEAEIPPVRRVNIPPGQPIDTVAEVRRQAQLDRIANAPRDEQIDFSQPPTQEAMAPPLRGNNVVNTIINTKLGNDGVELLYRPDPINTVAREMNIQQVGLYDIQQARDTIATASRNRLRGQVGDEVVAYRGVTNFEGNRPTVTMTLDPQVAQQWAAKAGTNKVVPVKVKVSEILSYGDVVGGTKGEIVVPTEILDRTPPSATPSMMAKPPEIVPPRDMITANPTPEQLASGKRNQEQFARGRHEQPAGVPRDQARIDENEAWNRRTRNMALREGRNINDAVTPLTREQEQIRASYERIEKVKDEYSRWFHAEENKLPEGELFKPPPEIKAAYQARIDQMDAAHDRLVERLTGGYEKEPTTIDVKPSKPTFMARPTAGEWTIRRLSQNLAKATHPTWKDTRFILPDGTRLTHGDKSHRAAADRAGVKLQDVLDSGVIRVAYGFDGVEIAGPITQAQAEVLADASFYTNRASFYLDIGKGSRGFANYIEIPKNTTANEIMDMVNSKLSKQHADRRSNRPAWAGSEGRDLTPEELAVHQTIYNALEPQKGNKFVVHDAGDRYTPEELARLHNSYANKGIANNMKAVLDDLHKTFGGIEVSRTHRFGFLADDRVGGVNLPNPLNPYDAAVMINHFMPMLEYGPHEAANSIVHVIAHEYAHNLVKEEGGKFTWALRNIMSKFGPEEQLPYAQRIERLISDGKGGYNSDIQGLLQDYVASRGRGQSSENYIRGPAEGSHLAPPGPGGPSIGGGAGSGGNVPPTPPVGPGQMPPPEGGPGKPKPPEKTSWVREAYNFARASTTYLDLSATLRQGLTMITRKEWWKSWNQQVKSLGSEEAYQRILSDLKNRPMFQRRIDFPSGKVTKSFAELAGIRLMDVARELSKREEAVASNWVETGGNIPGVSAAYRATLGRAARATNRAYTAFLNQLRADSFETLLKEASEAFKAGKKGAVDPYTNLDFAKKIADYVNTATGRGPMRLALPSFKGESAPKGAGFFERTGKGLSNLHIEEKSLEQHAQALTNILFSPRLLFAHARMLNPMTYLMADPFTRKQYIRSMLGVAGVWGTMIALAKGSGLADVSLDTNSADFGKMRFPGTNTRLDPAGGFQQYLVAGSRLLSGYYTASSTGEPHEMGAGFQATTQKDLGERFVANKLHPIVKFGYDLLNASEYQPFQVADRTAQLFVPLIVGDVMDIAKEDPTLLPWLVPPVTLGMGTQTYGKGEAVSKYVPKENDWTLTNFAPLQGVGINADRGMFNQK